VQYFTLPLFSWNSMVQAQMRETTLCALLLCENVV